MNNENDVESVLVGNCHLRLPSAICVDADIFRSVFSVETWENCFTPAAKQRILQKLPKELRGSKNFTPEQTVRDLLSGNLTRFESTPLEQFFNKLDSGLYEPSVVRTRREQRATRKKEARRLLRKQKTKELEHLILVTEPYLNQHVPTQSGYNQSNGFADDEPTTSSCVDHSPSNSTKAQAVMKPSTQLSECNFPDGLVSLGKRVRKRFHEELSAINHQAGFEDSEDEEFPVKKKPTHYTTVSEFSPVLSHREGGKACDKQFFEVQNSTTIANSSNQSSNQQLSKTYALASNAFNSMQPKVPKLTNLKSREEQTAAQMAKFPKILPAPSTSPSTILSPEPVTPLIVSAPSNTNPAEQKPLEVSSQFKHSPLLASQLQAPTIASNRQIHHYEVSSTKNMQSHSTPNHASTSSYGMNMNFERSTEDEMESSSEDEFESIEPTIGFASVPNSNSQVIAKNSKALSKNTRGVQYQGRIQSTVKSKLKSSMKVCTAKPGDIVSSKLEEGPAVPSIVLATSAASNSTATTTLVKSNSGAVQTQPSVFGITPITSIEGISIRLPAPPIYLTSNSSNKNPNNLISTLPPASTQVTPTIKLTPQLITSPLTTNKIFTSTSTGLVFSPELPGASTVIPLRSISSTAFNSNGNLNNTNSAILILNEPVKRNDCGVSPALAQSSGAKTSTGVVRIHCGTIATTPIGNNNKAPSFSTLSPISSVMPKSLGTALVSPISLQDLNFTINLEGNVVQANNNEVKAQTEHATEDKIDDLSGLDGNPFDSIPNLSDELDGFDFDLAEVCDFHSLMSDEKHYANFFSLIRDVLCSTRDHRMTFICLDKTIRKWSSSSSACSNSWYSSVCDWNEALITALNFLAGNYQDAHPEDFVPYIEYKYKTKYYQWIGAGRDSDNNLLPLYNMWLENLGRLPPIKKLEGETDDHDEDDDENEDSDGPDMEIKKKTKRPQTPPPPRFITTWTVKASSQEEKDYFQDQERQRFENPHKAFTYRMHEYESVVGPVKGVYSSQSGMTNKARGHSLLVDDRPPYVTILALVRDAVARLPNGEGTRSEICEMLRDSAFLAPEASSITLNSVVSGALDRLHYERDPCVRYDSHKKSWIYLHRDRNQEQFERLHHNRSYTKSTKSRSSTSRKGRKHNKSTSSTGSQSFCAPAPSTSGTSAQPSSSTCIVSATSSGVKLPPIEVLTGTKPIVSSAGQVPSSLNNNSQQNVSKVDGGLKSTAKTVYLQNQSSGEPSRGWQVTRVGSTAQENTTMTSPFVTFSASQATNTQFVKSNLELIQSTSSSGSSTSTSTVTQLVTPLSSPNFQMPVNSLSPGTQFVIGPANLARFGNRVRFAPAGAQTSNLSAFSGVRLSPRIVLRGSLPVQNQGLIVGQTASGQTIILSATPSGAAGSLRMQLPLATSQVPVSIQSQLTNYINSPASRPVISFSTANNTSVAAGSISAVPGHNDTKLKQDNSSVKAIHLNAIAAPKMLSVPSPCSSTLSVSALQQQLTQNVASTDQILKQQLFVVPASAGVITQTPSMKANQCSYTLPGSLSFGAGGEIKVIPIPGAGNHSLIARIVPQSPSDPSVAPIRLANPTPQNRASGHQ